MNLIIPVSPEDHALGSETAAVTLVEYGDYQCPDCARAHHVVGALVRECGSVLRFVFRNMPLTHAHRYAELAARAAEAAALQRRFWPMHDGLFERQAELGPALILELAERLALDVAQLERDINDARVIERIAADVDAGLRSGVQGTPTFYLNGLRYEDGTDVGTMTLAIERLARGSKRTRRSR
jgi:protein-disulfide isomerase